MKSPSIVGVFGLGGPELIIIMIILGVFAFAIVAVVWSITVAVRKKEEASAARDGAARALKKCPDCAELVPAEARVCKHCGLRFDT